MRQHLKLEQSTALKTGLIFALVLAITVGVLGGFVYWFTIGFMDRQTNTVIETDIEGLAETYQRGGLRGLIATIESRIDRDPTRSSIYLVADASRSPVVGNISAWPEGHPNADGWIEFGLTERTTGSHTRARVRPFLLRGQVNLLVGRDIRNLESTKSLIERALWWGMAFATVIGIGAGWLLSRRLRRRLDSIIRTSRDVMRGELSRRVPDFGSGDDLDEVARSLNAMLDEVQRLLHGIEHVTNNIAHDLRTPLARLRNELVDLRDAEGNAAGPDGAIDRCVAEVDQLLATFAALLRIAKLEAAGNRQHRGNVDLVEIVTAAIDLYEPVAQQRGISIRSALSAATVPGERDLLLQAICNVLDNAIKYSPLNVDVDVEIWRVGDTFRLGISDRGPGIPPTERERVFERFYRGDEARQTDGSGLGLSLVEAVCRYHGAEVTLHDNDPGLKVEIAFANVFPDNLPAIPRQTATTVT